LQLRVAMAHVPLARTVLLRWAMVPLRERGDVVRPRLFSKAALHPRATCTQSTSHSPSLMGLYETWTVRSWFPGDPTCTLPVPKHWQWLAPTEPDGLGGFAPLEDDGRMLVLEQSRLPFDVDPLAWIQHEAESQGLSVTLARQLADLPDARFETGGVDPRTGKVWRSSALLRGNRIVLVRGLAPAHAWEAAWSVLRPCSHNVVLSGPSRSVAAEARRLLRTRHAAFAVPVSWFVCAHHVCDSEVYLLRPTPEITRAMLRIDTGDASLSIAERQRRTMTALEGQGWCREGEITSYDGSIRTMASSSYGTLSHDGAKYHLRLSQRVLGKIYVDYTAVLPAEPSGVLEAMRTARAMEIAVETTVIHSATPMGETTLRPRGRTDR